VYVHRKAIAAGDDAGVLDAGRRRVAVDSHRLTGGVGVEGAQGDEARGDDDDAGETSER
jgi:hypothetical protein